MTPSPKDETKEQAEIIPMMRAYHAAMIEARVAGLDELLAPDYILIHITGVTQTKREWLDVIRSGAFDYHSIDLDESSLVVNVSGDVAMLHGRGIFNATIDGMTHPWRLPFAMHHAKVSGRWLIKHARYSSF